MQLHELLEHLPVPRWLDADAGVDHPQHHSASARPQRHQQTSAIRIAHRIDDQVAHDTLQEHRIGHNMGVGQVAAQRKALLGGNRRLFRAKAFQQEPHIARPRIRDHHAGVEPRNIEQRVEQCAHGANSGVDAVDHVVRARPRRFLAQRADEE